MSGPDFPVSPMAYGEIPCDETDVARAVRAAVEDRRTMGYPRQFSEMDTYATAYMMSWVVLELAEIEEAMARSP